jgi:hypothetical protein
MIKLVWQLAGVFVCLCCTLTASTQQPDVLPVNAPFGLPRMVNPSIDVPAKPFSYPSRPTDQIGVMGAPFGAEITPEGNLYTGFGELAFFLGIDRVPLNQRIRTLEAGHLPIALYDQEHDGLEYRFTVFAASLGPVQDGSRVVNFVRVRVVNPTSHPLRGYLTSAWRYQADQTTPFSTGDDRFRRPVTAIRSGAYSQVGTTFRADSAYTFYQNAFLRDGKAIYFYPSSPAPALNKTYRGYYGRVATPNSGTVDSGSPLVVLPTTPVAVAEFAIDVPAGGERALDFKVPLIPLAPTDPDFAAMQSADLNERHSAIVAAWNVLLDRGTKIKTPEDKVNQTFQASLVNNLLSLNHIGGDYIQTINQLHYHGFYLRDSADFVHMYDTTGYSDLARKVLDFYATRQRDDGNFLSQPGQYDGWGYSLLAYGDHYRYTHDKVFAAQIYPRVVHAVEWLQKAIAADPLHLVPATDVHDNEYVPGHLTGYNFLALDGLCSAEMLAHELGHLDDETRFRQIESQLRTSFLQRLDLVTRSTGGYIPPALDGNSGGTDWGNLLALTPMQQLLPTDPRVRATLKATQARYQEGLMTYHEPGQGTYLHHYLTIKNTLTELIVGDQQQAIREFYAELLHTTATHGGFEYSVRPWGDRDFSGNLSPHGWFAADFRNLLRNMLVREDDQTLHLLSAISPSWVQAGHHIEIDGTQTYFGQLGMNVSFPAADAVSIDLNANFDSGHAPRSIILHLPWFMDVSQIEADGKSVFAKDGIVELSSSVQHVSWHWKPLALPADFPVSYEAAVKQYKAEYARRYRALTAPDTESGISRW